MKHEEVNIFFCRLYDS